MHSLFLSQKTHSMLSSSVLSPSLTSLSLSFKACHRRSQRGEIGTWRVEWSQWWRCGFGSMIDGGDVGRSCWWFNMSLWCGLVLVCVEAWRRGGMETMAFWSALIFLCVGWSVLVDLMLIFLWFWVEIRWVLMEFWLACLEIGFWFNGFWLLMMVVMVVMGLWERGAMREWIIKNCKIMNILLNKCGE